MTLGDSLRALGAGLRALDLGNRQVLWSDRTGRWMPDSPAVRLALGGGACPAPLARRLSSTLQAADLTARIPARSRQPLLLPSEGVLWAPLPLSRTAGGLPWRAIALREEEIRLWRSFNSARTLDQAAARADVPVADALAFAARLTTAEVQALQLRDGPVSSRDTSLDRLLLPQRPAGARLEHQNTAEGGTTLERWHVEEIVDSAHHFDDVETTVAHCFALPHAALGGQVFGARLFDALHARGWVPMGGRVVEVGPGTGALAADWTAQAATRGVAVADYLRVDLSPVLLAAQAEKAPHTRGIAGSAAALPVADGSVDLLLSNEVMADLEAAPLTDEVRARVERFALAPLPTGSRYNLGAWKLVEECARVLRPGGCAYLSEFGDLDEVPTETVQLDHPEVSVHFGHLRDVALALGLVAEVVRMDTLLTAKLNETWLTRASFEGLRARLHAQGERLEARAWTVATLRLPWPVEGLREVPITQDGPGPVMTRFQALLLTKPAK
jgi:SAM-dependent methyltransferase